MTDARPLGTLHAVMAAPAQIVIDGVSHLYRPPRGRPVLALEDVSLEVRNARIRRAARPVRLRQVHAALSDRRLPAGRDRHDHASTASRSPAPGPDRGIVFQHFALFPWKTVRDNILYGLERQGMPKDEREKRAQRLHRSGRPAAASRTAIPSQLSGGMKQRTAHRAHARLRSEDPADGRAVRRARRADPRPDAGRAAEHLAAHAEDRDLRHPRRAGGGLSRRPRRGDVGAAGPHQDHRRHQVRQERPRHLQGQGLRRQGRRALESGARRGDQGAGQCARHEARVVPLSAARCCSRIAWEAGGAARAGVDRRRCRR